MAAKTALQKITAEAKRIRKAKPSISWKSAIKQAGVLYRSKAKKVFHTKKKASARPKYKVKKVASKTVIVKTSRVGSTRGGGIPGGKEMRMSYLHSELGRFENVRAALKKKKRETSGKANKNNIEKVIRYYNNQINQAKRNIDLLRKI